MPFAKGRSGNPGGRPKGVEFVQQLAREHTVRAMETLVSIMQDEEAPAAARAAAAEKILDRGYGKPVQPIDGDGQGNPIRQMITVRFVKPGDPSVGNPIFDDRPA